MIIVPQLTSAIRTWETCLHSTPFAPPTTLTRPLALPVFSSPPPLPVSAWRAYLANHPDQSFATYILNGLKDGFRIGFDRTRPLRSSRRNMKSALENKAVVDAYIDEETRLGRLIRLPAASPLSLSVHTSPFGVIPKKGRPGDWRLIVDLSSPDSASVNDGISSSLTSIHYASIDDAVTTILALGTGTLMAKLDLKAAYRSVPVHRVLLGTRWENSVYVDTALPFGLSSAPKIFSAVADALLWIMLSKGISWAWHYLDDFILFGKPHTTECSSSLATALQTCSELGWVAHKIEGPVSCLVFLVDSALSLPADKLRSLKGELAKWRLRKSCIKKELLSLIGQLNHAAKVIRPGRTFLRRLIDLSCSVSCLHHHIRLNVSARSDIAWWSTFCEEWNGVGLFISPSPAASVHTDAAGNWGCGAMWSSHWFQIKWPADWLSLNIAIKELLPIVVAAATWGSFWRGSQVLCFSDNMSVVHAICSRSVRNPQLMRLLRALFFVEAHFNMSLGARHVAGVSNTAADALSRDNVDLFRLSAPQADAHPSPPPEGLLPLLFNLKADWPSPIWCQQLNATLSSP